MKCTSYFKKVKVTQHALTSHEGLNTKCLKITSVTYMIETFYDGDYSTIKGNAYNI